MNKKRVLDLCAGIRREGLDVRWYCNTRVHLVDPDLLREMRLAGCSGISYGVESGNQGILDTVSKQATVAQAEHAIRWAKEAGIKTYCAFILGLPGETRKSALDTIDFAMRTLPNGAQFNVLAPYPGTELYETLRAKGVLPDVDWRALDQESAAGGAARTPRGGVEPPRALADTELGFQPPVGGENPR